MKTVTHDLRYDGATQEQVYTMLGTEQFRDQVCDYQRFPKRFVTITPSENGMAVKVDQYRSTDEVPAAARKLVGDEINIVQEETWTSHTDASLTVTIPGKPGDMRGSVHIAEIDGGVTETVEVNIKVSVPLVGGKIETFIGDMLMRALKAENKVGRSWLASH